MRDRLAEIYHNIEIEYLDYLTNIAERAIDGDIEDKIQKRQQFYVDKLLANGVIVSPCKVGDIVWVKDFEKCCVIQEAEIIEIVQNKYGTHIRYEYPAFRGRIYARSIEYIGKTVFLTREEAEQALKGR